MIGIECIVFGPQGAKHVFEVEVVASKIPAEQGLEPEFYNKFGKGPPQEPHFELEVLSVPKRRAGTPMHVHTNPHTNRTFICYVLHIATLDAAVTMFTTWCLGTAYALVVGEDFVPILRDVQMNDQAFVVRMQEMSYRAEVSIVNVG